MYIEVVRGKHKGCRGYLTKQFGGVSNVKVNGKLLKVFGTIFDKNGNEYPITDDDFVFREIHKHESLGGM